MLGLAEGALVISMVKHMSGIVMQYRPVGKVLSFKNLSIRKQMACYAHN